MIDVFSRVLASLGALFILLVLLVAFTPLNQDMTWGSQEMGNIMSTTTAEFSLEGIDNQDQLRERIEVMIEKQRATQAKQKAEQKLEDLQRKQTSLE